MENKEKIINNEKNNKIEEYKKIEEYFNDKLAKSSEEEKNYVINCILAITEKERIDESEKELLKYIEYTKRVFKIDKVKIENKRMQPEYRKKVEDYVTNDANMEKGHHIYWTYIMINLYENKYKNTEYEKELYRYISHLISREAEKISMRDDKNPKYGITKKESIKFVNLYNNWQFKVKEEKDKKEKAKKEDKGEK